MRRIPGRRFRAAGIAVMAAVLAAVVAAGCGGAGPARREPVEEKRPLAEIIAEVAPEWMALPGVVGVYEGADPAGEPCLKVMVETATEELRRRIPGSVEGYPVLLRETGPVAPRGEGE